MEHHYGTIKRQWGFNYILTKKEISRAGSDVGLMFISHNLRRIGNILTVDVLKEYLRMLASLFFAIFDLIEAVLRNLGAPGALRPEFTVYGEFSRKNRLAT
ncbi:MAG: hypothetical protein ACUVTX_07470 [Bacteroidales bacterium]